jgi:hypothetical protein
MKKIETTGEGGAGEAEKQVRKLRAAAIACGDEALADSYSRMLLAPASAAPMTIDLAEQERLAHERRQRSKRGGDPRKGEMWEVVDPATETTAILEWILPLSDEQNSDGVPLASFEGASTTGRWGRIFNLTLSEARKAAIRTECETIHRDKIQSLGSSIGEDEKGRILGEARKGKEGWQQRIYSELQLPFGKLVTLPFERVKALTKMRRVFGRVEFTDEGKLVFVEDATARAAE